MKKTQILVMAIVMSVIFVSTVTAEVPYTFTPGTPAKSAEVNANFQHVNYGNIIVKDGNGQEIGTFLGIVQNPSTLIIFLSPLGYTSQVNPSTGAIDKVETCGLPDDSCDFGTVNAIPGFYIENTCSGNAYVCSHSYGYLSSLGLKKNVFIIGNKYYYIAESAALLTNNLTMKSMMTYSSGLPNGVHLLPTCIDGDIEFGQNSNTCRSYYQLSENNPIITGIQNSYTPPITIQRR